MGLYLLQARPSGTSPVTPSVTGNLSLTSLRRASLSPIWWFFEVIYTNHSHTSDTCQLTTRTHTIGLTYCSKIIPRIYNFPGSRTGADPYLNKTFVVAERRVCPNNRSVANKFLPLDSSKGGQTFDVSYFNNVLAHKAVLKSDDALISASSGRRKVLTLASSQSIFFSRFAAGMEKMSRVG
ncbi:hypothetical protein R1flu_001826 [Riccia fluitans]|uniref:Plant heme peroxidase family profile domain-containing protein n=1 Tax=Riccia fluitans TaxID=41844 RepID=A0ABD1Y4E1_9MARC